MASPLRRLTPRELADGAAEWPPLLDGAGLVDPLVVVDLDVPTGADTARRAAERAGSVDRLLVGVRTRGQVPPELAVLTEALDTTLAPTGGRTVVPSADPAAALTLLQAAVTVHPQPVLVLGQVLRTSEHLSVDAALDVESYAYSTLLGGPDFAHWLGERGPRPLPPPAVRPPLLVRRAGDTLHLTLNRPERRNAYGAQLRDSLVEALRLAVHEETLQVVLDGAGTSFCAGGDLDEFGTTPGPGTAHLVRTRGGAGRLLHRLAERTTVHLHGSCIGAGIELPALAGRVLAHPGTVFRLPEVGMGLIPGAGGTASLPRRIGRWRAFHLCATGVALDAATALAWGLVDALTGDTVG
ncbi:enoyl-CoA hydratase/isomerase family protein [Rhodococcus sp. X156]|uniref:enoyl-CoA hydratase/isomerase family protein n=1 Tax=Rhodococcus sp. X156 TaxID=2499145 RepID=UPI000FD6C6AC|nr:enoyl-CoA hydratase/isomerase family protein [Rhodococcus sp. X156]